MPWWPWHMVRAGLVGGLLIFSTNFSSAQTLAQQAYLKASTAVAADNFGAALAISGDTAVVGARYEDTGLPNSGAVYVFVRNGANWTQQAQLKSSQQGNADNFGFSVAISGDTIVVGARNEDSSTTTVNSTPNESATNAGAAYVFVRSGTNWIQQAYLKASNAGAGDNFGDTVAISTNTIVVGAPFEDSDATTINGSSGNNSKTDAGAAYVFVRSGSSWSQQAYLKASNSGSGDVFGDEVAISGDTVVVGAFGEDSSSTGVNSSANESASSAGAAYVFVRNGTNWSQQAYLKASNTGAGDDFGSSLAIEDQTIVVGAPWEDSSSTGINAIANEAASNAGAAYVFVRSGTSWSQQAYLKASNAGADDEFGDEVAISGNTVVVGAFGEDSSTTGVNSSGDDSATFSGAAYVFVRSGSSWTQQAYLKASNTDAYDVFGDAVAIFGDTVVVGASEEESNGSSQTNNAATGAGAAYVFTGFGAEDPDGDGLTDAQEVILGTNPNFADTDGDGLNDNVEANTPSLNPLLSEMPGMLVAKQSDASGFVATWGPVAGAAGYEVQVSTEPSFTSGLIGGDRAVSGSTTASLAITGMTNQIRYYRVRTVIPSSGGPVKTGWSPAVSAPDLSGFGNYLALNGGTTNANSLPIASDGLPDNGSYTITFWMRPDRIGGVSGTENVQVFRQPINTDTNTANVDLDLMPDGSLVFGQKDPSLVERKVQTASKMILASNWYHVALVRDATNTELRLYLNGVGLVTNNSAFGTNSWSISVAGGPAAVQAALNNDANTNRIKGAFDDVRVYLTVRTQSQILEDMSGPLTRANATNATNSALVFYAPLEGTSVTTGDTNTIFKGILNGSGSGTFITQSTLTLPVLSWSPDPVATLFVPATLANSLLTATAKTAAGAPIPGSWTYTPAAGSSLPVGTNQIVGTFVPQDLDTYSVGTITNWVVVTDPDTDEDGFTDGEEIAAGTDPNSASSFLTNGVTGRVLGWGWVSSGDPLQIPESLRSGVDQVVASPNESFAVALQGGVPTVWALDSTATNLVATKLNGSDRPTNGVLQVAAGWGHVIALKENGSVVVWGDDTAGRGLISGAPLSSDTNYIAVASGDDHCLALKKDGTVVAWGRSVDSDGTTATGQLNFAGVTNVVGIAAGLYHSLALKSDGTLVGKGRANYGAANVDPGLTGVVAVAAGRDHSVVLLANGNLEAWGRNSSGQSNVPDGTSSGNPVLTNVSAMPAARFAAGRYYSIGVREDGKVLEWGQYRSDSTNYVDVENQTPGWLTNVVGVTAGRYYSLVIRSDAKAPRLDLPANLVRLTPGGSTNLTLKSTVSSQTFSQVGLPAGITLSSNGLLAVGNSVAPTNVFARIMVANTNGSDARVIQLQVLSGDTNPPVITLAGNSLVLLESGDSYTDAGATATDDVDASVPLSVSIQSTTIPGSITYSDGLLIGDTIDVYTITYRATDAAGYQAIPVTRTVKVFPNGYLAWANRYGLFGANVPDLAGNGDADGLDNLGEFTAGTDPGKADTDGDGTNDNTDIYPLTANHNFDVYLGLIELCRQDSAAAPVPDYPDGVTTGAVFEKLVYATAPAGAGIARVEVRKSGGVVNGGDLRSTNPAGPGRIEFGPTNTPSQEVVNLSNSQWERNLLPHGNYTFHGLSISNLETTNVTINWNDGTGSGGAAVVAEYPTMAPRLTGTNWINGDLCLPNATNAVLTWSNNWTNQLNYGWIRVELERRLVTGTSERLIEEIAVNGSNLPTQMDLGAKRFLTNNAHYTGKLIFSVWKDGLVRAKATRFHLVTGPQTPPTAPTLASLVASNGANLVGRLASTDADAGDTVTLSLPGGAFENDLFLVNSINDLKLISGNFDRAVKASYRILVRATDSHGLFAETVFNLTVPKKTQSITFSPISPKNFGAAAFAANATAGSGLAVSYTSSNPGVAIVVGGDLQILGAGATDITASQAGNDVYEAATPVTQTLTVNSTGTAISSGSGVGVSGGISSASTTSAAPIVRLPGSMRYGEKIPLPGAVQVSRVGENNLNLAIPDGNLVGMSRQLNLTGLNLSNYRLTVGLKIQGIDFGASLGDYHVYLRHSGSGITEQTRVLLDRVGTSGSELVGSLADGINAIFADAADTNIQNATDPLTGPLLGTFQPTSLLSGSSHGLNSMGSTDWNGTWTLFVADQQSGGAGNLVDWFMQFEDLSAATATASDDGLEYEVVDNPTVVDDGTGKGVISGNELEAKSGTGRITIRAAYPGGTNWTTNTITLEAAAQTLTFTNRPVTVVQAPPFNLLDPGATTSSGRPVVYTSSNTNVAAGGTNQVSILAPGVSTLRAVAPADDDYGASSEVSQVLTVLAPPASLPFREDFSSPGLDRLMPIAYNGAGPLTLAADSYFANTSGRLTFSSPRAAAAIAQPNLTLPLTNSWTVEATVNVPNSSAFHSVGLNIIRDLYEGGQYSPNDQLTLHYYSFGGSRIVRSYQLTQSGVSTNLGTNLSSVSALRLAMRYDHLAKEVSFLYRDSTNSPWQTNGVRSLATNGTIGTAWGLKETDLFRVGFFGETQNSTGTAGADLWVDDIYVQVQTVPELTLSGILTGKVDEALSGGYPVLFSGHPPIVFSASNLPAGLTIGSSNGLITGTPSAGGAGTATIYASNSYGLVSTNLAFNIAKAASTITVTGTNSFTFSGNPQGPGPLNVSQTGSGGAVSVSYEGVSPTVYASSTNRPTNAGSYQAVASVAADSNYDGASSSPFLFTIAKAVPTISAAPTASAITYGQTLAASTLTGGTASPTGSFAFTSPSVVPNAGTNSVSVTFTPSDTANYTTATTNVSVVVNQAVQTITFNLSSSSVLSSSAPFTLSASASSGLAVTFETSSSSVATVFGNSLTIVGPGTVTITAKQAGNGNYGAATDVPRILTVVDANVPLAGADSGTAAPVAGSVIKFHIDQLLANDDPSADPSDTRTLTFGGYASASLRGGAVSRKGSWIICQITPAAVSAGGDSFTYTVSNGTGIATGTVNIAMAMPVSLQIEIESMTNLAVGKRITFAVSPNTTFEVQASSDLSNWTTLNAAATSLSDGRLVVDDPGAGGARFYRLRWIP